MDLEKNKNSFLQRSSDIRKKSNKEKNNKEKRHRENNRKQDILLIGRKTIEIESIALHELASSLGEEFIKTVELIFQCSGTILLTGMGKSGLVARKWASTFSSTGTTAFFINPAEASHGDLGIVRKADVLIALSYQGETAELSVLLRHAAELKIPRIAVTARKKSSLASQSTLILPIRINEEACPLGLAPTSSTTAMMALGDAVAVALMEKRGFTIEDFGKLHPGGSLGRKLWLQVENLMHKKGEIPRVKRKEKLQQVLLEMTEKRLGLAVVMEENEICGVITDGDLRRFFQREEKISEAWEKIQAEDLMTRDPKTILSGALAVDARKRMEELQIQHLLVTESNQKLVGVLHLQDLLRAKVL